VSRDRTFVEAKGPANHADLNDEAFQRYLDEAMGSRNAGDSGGRPVGPDENVGPARDGTEDQGGAFDVESTPIGDQYRVPGTDRAQVANRDAAVLALKQKQSKMRRPDQVRVEDDAAGLFAEPNLDFFDDMMSPKARAYIDQTVADLREVSDQGFGVDVPPGLVSDEGMQLTTTRDILDEFDDMDAMEREFRACMTSGVVDGA
jgi:hypothetical protein